MRVGSFVVVGSALVVVISAAACTQQVTRSLIDEPKQEAEPESSAKTNTPTASGDAGPTDDTCLGKANLAFDDVACNTCMSDNADCCQATIACFKDDPSCAALHTCIQACEGKGGGNGDGGGNGGGGNGDGGGGGNGSGGAKDGGTGGGAACKDACKTQHAASLAKWQAYNTCAAVTCKADCL